MSQSSVAEVGASSERHFPVLGTVATPPFLQLTNVIACTDFSPAASAAMQVAEQLCQATEAHLSVLHVCGADLNAADPISAAEWARIDLAERQQTEDVSEGLKRRGVNAEAVVRIGRAAECILAEIALRRADLVVLGTHARGGMSRMLFGSTAEAVFRAAPCAVMTVGPGASWQAAAEERGPVIFATDFQDRTKRAAMFAASVANSMHVELACVHVLPVTMRDVSNPVVSIVIQEALEHLTNHGRICSKRPRTDVLYDYDVSHAIVEYARQRRASAIVLGIQRKSVLVSHLPPHRAFRVLMNAPCPVLTFSYETRCVA